MFDCRITKLQGNIKQFLYFEFFKDMKVGVIGSAGRKDDAQYVSVQTFAWVVEKVRSETSEDDILVSGTGAFCDHSAVIVALERGNRLVLELPAEWDSEKKQFKENEPGRISNFYHRKFSTACGWPTNRSLEELDQVMRRSSTVVKVTNGFFARNSLIADESERLLAFCFHEPGPNGPSGGTGNTWRKCKSDKQCFVIPTEPSPEDEVAMVEHRATLGSWPKPSAELMRKLDLEYAVSTVYPPKEKLFTALELCPLSNVKVVILGQDCYHGPGQAHGLAFSVEQGRAPPSLVNIFAELKSDLGQERTEVNLSDWAAQGVLLLNTLLSVKAGQAASHENLGWQAYTDELISLVSRQCDAVVFILWGRFAQGKRSLIDRRHYILTAAHPSPLSASNGFFRCRHFSKANAWLEQKGKEPIKWVQE